MNGQPNTNGMLFMHVPIPEYLDVFNNYDYYGYKNDIVSCAWVNHGLFEMLYQTNMVQWISVGHDHKNSLNAIFHDKHLVYGRKTGDSGLPVSDDMVSGARVFELSLNRNGSVDVETWIRESPDGSLYNEEYKEGLYDRPAQSMCAQHESFYQGYCLDFFQTIKNQTSSLEDDWW